MVRFLMGGSWHGCGLQGRGDQQRYYRCWDIDDIFSRITQTPGARSKLWLGVQELVDMRNNIAHGDLTAQPAQADIQRYTMSARTFCERADGLLARVLGKLTQEIDRGEPSVSSCRVSRL